MTSGDTPPGVEIDKLNDQLNDGLKTCRSMINDYRAVLSAPQASDSAEALGSSSDDSLIDTYRTQDGSNL